MEQTANSIGRRCKYYCWFGKRVAAYDVLSRDACTAILRNKVHTISIQMVIVHIAEKSK